MVSEALMGAPRTIDLDRVIELFDRPCVPASGCEGTSPTLQRVGFLPSRIILLMDGECRFELTLGGIVVVMGCRKNAFRARHVASPPKPILSGGHYLTASSYLLSGCIEPVHRDVDSSEPWTRAHFLQDHRSSVLIVESVLQMSFGAGVLTEMVVDATERSTPTESGKLVVCSLRCFGR